ncbi:hypothetical protein [Bacillus wiedmannii]|uniref:hypothetical protein n=1 Tax=Bacillus wiedmannii TaxID=1890302 RepID=UPI00027C035C|nr:hypothetical protein [Bacillus wiedmannii]EJV69743.1 hypothetical protein IEO_00466 [Bacillus wiedmannii]PEA46067.1 hypothetical protein CON83_02465 [Bacillus wiedmannii]PGD55401.1 hypothetical protein COM40_18620 [Bacillus wiedmannii]PHA24212.1 hypothetical protein COE59_17065 [Bacillus wiedmannii]PHA62431.1 hypothetical protein COF07_00275 [Bacillus wiedmannii]
MWLLTAIAPVVIVGGIVVYVIERLKHKYNNGNLGKKKSKKAQVLLDSFIPMGMLLGCLIGIIVDIFFPNYSLFTIGLGAGIGYLFGFFAYEFYSKTGNDFS